MKNLSRFVVVFFVSAFLCGLSVGSLFAQDEGKKEAQQVLVTRNVLVLDKKDNPFAGLGKNDFRVFDDEAKQEIAFFSNEPQPLLMGIVLDASGSLRKLQTPILSAAGAVINDLKENDEAFLYKFIGSDKIYELQDFTNEKRRLMSGLDDYYVEGGQTAFLDVVYKTSEKLAKYKEDENKYYHRVLILITDGEDKTSVFKEEEVLRFLRENDVQIFVIGLVQELEADGGLLKKSKREVAMNLLDRVTRETGGRVFYQKKAGDIPSLVGEFLRNLRTQYFIGFAPADRNKGKYHRVRVEVTESQGRDKLKVLTRAGYTLK